MKISLEDWVFILAKYERKIYYKRRKSIKEGNLQYKIQIH